MTREIETKTAHVVGTLIQMGYLVHNVDQRALVHGVRPITTPVTDPSAVVPVLHGDRQLICAVAVTNENLEEVSHGSLQRVMLDVLGAPRHCSDTLSSWEHGHVHIFQFENHVQLYQMHTPA